MPPAPAHSLRIIGGAWRRRRVRLPDAGADLRPTPDRVRETLFNWLGQDLAELRCLEPYAGTGVLSLEALSRGAGLAVAVDRQRPRVAALAAIGRELRASGLETHCADARGFLAAERRSFDVIFLDPPFGEEPWDWLLPSCVDRLAPGGSIYAEAPRALEAPPALEVWRSDKAGQVHYHLFRHREPAA